ncbi:Uncharacterised protein [uncultured archaeon]|nr:Uncharacterised protein [uncultured archaeon]
MRLDFDKKTFARILISILAGMVLGALVFSVQEAVHETGHVIGCYMGSAIYGGAAKCTITNWQKIYYFPPFLYLTIPQQTASRDYPVFAFGGPALSMLFFLWLASRQGLRRSGISEKMVSAAIIVFELVNNVACGTDNLQGAPADFCTPAISSAWFGISFLIVMAAMAIMAYHLPEDFAEWRRNLETKT